MHPPQAACLTEGVNASANGAVVPGLGFERGAECSSTGTDPVGGRTEHPEGTEPAPGPEQRPPRQPVPGPFSTQVTVSETRYRNSYCEVPVSFKQVLTIPYRADNVHGYFVLRVILSA